MCINMISEQSKKRHNAFWENEVLDRFMVNIGCESNPPPPPAGLIKQEYAVKKWTDIDYRVALEGFRHETTTWYCDGFSRVFTNFGPGSLSACIGGDFEPAEHTVWFDTKKVIKDWDDYPEIKLHRNSQMWRMTVDFTTKLCQSSNGRYHTSIADIGGSLDIVASLRGTQDLLMDLYDKPEKVKELSKKLRPIWRDAFYELCNIISEYEDGYTTWLPIWCKGTYFPLQCDFSAMLSPEMFGEFVMPDLIYQTEIMDRSIYHLDGPGQLAHVDQLLTIPRLNAIQWVPGDGNPDTTDPCWFELYEKIQSAGKGIVLGVGHPEGIENLIKNISPKGAYVTIWGCSEYDAKKIEEMIML